MSRGNPHYAKGLKERREKLLELLLDTPIKEWGKAKANFAFHNGLTEKKVNEYFITIKKAGLLDTVQSVNGDNNGY